MRRLGAVLRVEGAGACIWVNGVTPAEGVTMDIPASMPGWLVQTGATFDARGIESAEDIATASFEFQPMSWQTYGRAIEPVLGSDD